METKLQKRPTAELTTTAAAASREQAEIQGQLVMARQFPRDVNEVHAEIMHACRVPRFAEEAIYSFPRGGTRIEGPSVALAREMARAWRNIRSGFRVTDSDAQYTTVEGFALDCETNALKVSSFRFKRLIYRKRGGWQEPDERDFRELVNRNGAIVERNAILNLLPAWLKNEALDESKKTLRKAAEGKIEQDRDATIRSLAAHFRQYGVTVEMLERRIGHPLQALTADELTELRGNAAAIRDGNASVEELFPPVVVKDQAEDQDGDESTLDKLAKGAS